MRRVLSLALATAALGLSAGPALAAITVTGTGSGTTATITSDTTIGDSFTINMDGEANGVVIPGLSSSVTLTYEGTDTSTNSYLFSYLVNNTSSTASRVTVFGFDTNPNITSATSTGVFPNVSSGQLASYNLEVCFDSGNTKNCNSSTGGAGIANGTSGNGTLALNFGSLPESIQLSNFLDRYQGVGTDGISAEGHPVGAVPEPATWAMMLLGFGGIGMTIRRRRKATLAQIA